MFGTGGGEQVAGTLQTRLGYPVPLLARIPLDPRVRMGGDTGVPLIDTEPDVPAARALADVATALLRRAPSLVGRSLNLNPVG